ncbi:GNAT family N-acetyltransferase [Rossellomorea sp. NS-SX7]|uniref:GNAT family N-acetyltransferase n=1 Tax=Rossellomorea sp. NS-SX7 TaxID=3463856 RepID=UPI004059FA26
MNIKQVYEYDIDRELRAELQRLLTESFEDDYPRDRIYYKQLPHFRFIAYDDHGQLAGQAGLDYRIMNVNGERVKVLGIIDLCVAKDHRSQGIGSILLSEIEAFCKNRAVDFLLLFADKKDLYIKAEFKSPQSKCKWLQINDVNQTTYGIGHDKISELMIKEVGDRKWEDGEVDLLGYLY